MSRTIEAKVAAVAMAQNTVLIHLGTWMRSPSRESRQRLEESMTICEDTIDKLLCPFRLDRDNLSAIAEAPNMKNRGRPRKRVQDDAA